VNRGILQWAPIATAVLVFTACGGSGVNTTGGSGGTGTGPSGSTQTTATQRLKTEGFLPGMDVIAPADWFVGEDDPVEFKIYPPGSNAGQDPPGIRFWLDPQASTPCSDRALDVPMTAPRQIVSWLASNKNVRISHVRQVTLAGRVALRVDLTVAPAAPHCDPACPHPCIDYFLFTAGGATHPFGTGGPETARFWLARLAPTGHVLVMSTFAEDDQSFATLNAAAADVAASLQLPDPLPV
jgi:hypothetical protein